MPAVDNLFLPDGYHENPVRSSDLAGHPFWTEEPTRLELSRQEPVYRLAARLARRHHPPVVVDVGCGSGQKLVRLLSSSAPRVVGVDQESAMALARRDYPQSEWLTGDIENDPALWAKIAALRPQLVVCADVIEHVAAPAALLQHLRSAAGGGRVLLSTPDRGELAREGAPSLGPPKNTRHVREWTEPELRQLISTSGFDIEEVHHLLPRRYFATVAEVRRTLGRLRAGMAIPDRKSCMAFVLRPQP